MSAEPEPAPKSHRPWGRVLFLLSLIAAPVVAQGYWSHDAVWAGMLVFYFVVGLALRSPVILCMLFGILISPLPGGIAYLSEEEIWEYAIISGGLGLFAGLLVELVWTNLSRK